MNKIRKSLLLLVSVALMGSGIFYGIVMTIRIDSSITHFTDATESTMRENIDLERYSDEDREYWMNYHSRNVRELAQVAREGWNHVNSLSWILFNSGLAVMIIALLPGTDFRTNRGMERREAAPPKQTP